MTLKHFWTNLDDCTETDSPLSYSRGRVLESSAYESKVMTDDPVGYWKLDETSGTTMVDSSGFGRNGTYLTTGTQLNGSALRAGAKGSLNITSINGGGWIPYAGLEVGKSSGPPVSYAIEAVVSMSSATAGSVYKWVVGMIPGQNTGNVQYGIAWRGVSNAFPTGKGNGTGIEVVSSTAAVDIPVHIVFEEDATNTVSTIYVNGIAHGTFPSALGYGDSSNIFVGGGATQFPSSYGMIGSISDIAIYDHALGANRALIHAQAGGFSPL